ncbi:hypothetical protein ACIP5U_39395 [Streptomyces sp. NPDC088788]|uniref:hypothetical protein n=1 Tax=Streptomyces sp. NPDC088788 TaxID=3365898 RepID=UPI003818B239
MTIKSVAGDLGVNTETLWSWTGPPTGAVPAATRHSRPLSRSAVTPFRAALTAARTMIRELEEEHDIFSTAARYVAAETRW